ncbi:MAG: serine hydrolase domain-containing protein [Chitinophagaceae bacterium]
MKALIIFCLFIISLNGIGQDNIKLKIQSYEKQLNQLLIQNKLPSLSFAIVKNQKLIYSNAIGFADVKKMSPATDTTLYSIASLTKPIASAIILKLAEEGAINLDDKMKDHWLIMKIIIYRL